MKIAGFLVILNALILCGYYATSTTFSKTAVFAVTTLAIFSGIFFIVSHRDTEVTIEGVGSIKAAAESASADATAIAEIKKRVESQSATIDLVAAKASEAHTLSKEAKRNLDFTVDVQAALTGDRHAFNRIANEWKKEPTFKEMADQMEVAIRSEGGGPIEPGYLNLGRPELLKGRSLQEMEKFYDEISVIFHPHTVKLIIDNQDFSRRDKLQFCKRVLHDDSSLTATRFAATFVCKESGIDWQPYRVEPLIQWIDTELSKTP